MLPVAILLVSIALAAYFYHLLPGSVAYHFKPDGTPDRWLNRSAIFVWTLAPQLFLTLLALAITWGTTKLSARLVQPERTRIKPGRILLVMGNMMALPEIVLCFAMLDIFRYNSYQTHMLPVWIFALIVLLVGGIILSIFFIKAIWQTWKTIRQKS